MGEHLVAIIYTAAAATTVGNTTTETSLLTTPLVMPVNSLVAGTTLRFAMVGNYQTTAIPGTLRLRLKVTNTTDGTITVGDTGTRVLAAGLGGFLFAVDALYSQRTAGATGTSQGAGLCTMSTTLALADIWQWVASAGGTDTTVTNTFDITAQFSIANITNVIRSDLVVIEILTGV